MASVSGSAKRQLLLGFLAILSCLALFARIVDTPARRLPELRIAPPPPAETTRNARLAVQVVSGDPARAVSGATVRVLWEQERTYYEAGRAVTDREGVARFDALPRGVAWVIVDAPSLARASTQLTLDETPREATVALAPSAELTVTVRDETDRALAGATVLVTTGDPLPFGALADGQGRALFNRLGAAPWTVKASARGYESLTQSGVTENVTITLRRLGTLLVKVEEPGGAPARGAEVLIAGSSLWPARRATTGDDGETRIAGLLAGTYDLKAYRGELVSDTLHGIELERGADKAVTLRLGAGRRVIAWVTDGEGSDATGVSGADVVLAEAGLTSFPLRGRTGTDGTVELGPVSGHATLSAIADGFVGRAAVVVPEGERGRVQLALLRGATIEGEVVDTRDRAVDGASIEIIGTDVHGFPIAETPLMTAMRRSHFNWSLAGPSPLIPAGELGVMPGPIPPIPPPSALGDAFVADPGVSAGAGAFAPTEGVGSWVTRMDGRFTATPVTPGRVRALVRHPAFVEGISDLVVLAPGGTAKVKVVMLAGGALEGKVVDASGRGVSGARVDVAATAGTLERTTITASDGSFAFAAVPAEVLISVARPDDLSRIVVRRSVEVEEGGKTTIEIKLPSEREAVRVRVRDGDGKPVDTAQVTFLSLDPEVPLRQTLFTTADGVVELADARGLRLQLVVEASGWAKLVRSLAEAPAEVTLTLDHGVLVEGKVTAVRGRRAVERASVTLLAEGRRWVTSTNSDGVYRVRDVSPGHVRVTVSHGDFASAALDVEVKPTGRADRAFELPTVDLSEAGRVEGTVLDGKGQPVAGARVGVGMVPAYLPAGSLPAGLTQTDKTGRFVLDGVAPGSHELEAYAPEVGRGRASVRVDSGRTSRNVTLRLTAPAGDDIATVGGSVAVTLGERTVDGEVEVVIVNVATASEAERAGLAVGDVLLSVDGVDVTTMTAARGRLSGRPGSDVVLEVDRAGRELSLRVPREAVRR